MNIYPCVIVIKIMFNDYKKNNLKGFCKSFYHFNFCPVYLLHMLSFQDFCFLLFLCYFFIQFYFVLVLQF